MLGMKYVPTLMYRNVAIVEFDCLHVFLHFYGTSEVWS